jgi:hypothetical protein
VSVGTDQDAEYLEAIVSGDDDPTRRWSGPEETHSLNSELVAKHADREFEAVTAYASASRTRLASAIHGLRALPPERFWERGSLLRGIATHRTHHLLPILEWRDSDGGD